MVVFVVLSVVLDVVCVLDDVGVECMLFDCCNIVG